MRSFKQNATAGTPAGKDGTLAVGATLFGVALGLADGIPILFSDPLILSPREKIGYLALEVLVLSLAGLLVGLLLAGLFSWRGGKSASARSCSLSVAALSAGALLVCCVTWMGGIAAYAAALFIGGWFFLGREWRPRYLLMCAALPPVIRAIAIAGEAGGPLAQKMSFFAALLGASLALYVLAALLGRLFRGAPRQNTAVAAPLCIIFSLSTILVIGSFFLPVPGQPPQTPSKAPNLVFILVDALRSDRLGAYGYAENVSPVIDGLARKGAYFTTVVSASPQTRSSMPSMMTSQPPSVHGVDMRSDFEKAIPPGIETLAEMLASAGYRTAAFVSNPWLKVTGLDRGFQEFNDSTRLRKLTRTGSKFYLLCMKFWSQIFNYHSVYAVAGRLNSQVIPWLKERSGSPFFLFVHYMDTHDPYIPPPEFAGELGDAAGIYFDARESLQRGEESEREKSLGLLKKLYDGEIRYLDSKLGELIAVLDELGRRENTLVLLTADHGEEFGEHGDIGHNQTLYDEVLLVPLILNMPGRVEGVGALEGQCSALDIVPTVLAILDRPVPGGLAGVSQYPFDENRPARSVERIIFSESTDYFSARSGRWKFIRDRAGRLEELYDLKSDPGETRNIIKKNPAVADSMRKEIVSYLKEIRERAAIPLPADMTEESRERLESLGYVVK